METLNKTTLPRQFLTGSLIALVHGVLLLLIALNPIRHLQNPLKETIVMMVPSVVPHAEVPTTPQNTSKPTPRIASPVTPQFAAALSNPSEMTATIAISSDAPMTSNPVVQPTQHMAPAAPRMVSAVEYIQAPQADYPPMARRMGEEGRVVMQVLVNDKGRAEKVEIIKSSGFSRLDESARLALLRALFKPYLEDGKSMMVLATASINFSLRG